LRLTRLVYLDTALSTSPPIGPAIANRGDDSSYLHPRTREDFGASSGENHRGSTGGDSLARIQDVALFGTRFVVESRMFGMLEGVEVVVPGQVDAIHRAYMQIVEGGSEGREILSQIIRELPVDAVLLAGRIWLSAIFDESNTCSRLTGGKTTERGAGPTSLWAIFVCHEKRRLVPSGRVEHDKE
jgi:hypothetical protein